MIDACLHAKRSLAERLGHYYTCLEIALYQISFLLFSIMNTTCNVYIDLLSLHQLWKWTFVYDPISRSHSRSELSWLIDRLLYGTSAQKGY